MIGKNCRIFLLAALVPSIWSVPVDPVSDMVVVTDSSTKIFEDDTTLSEEPLVPPKITEMSIRSHITNRYAKTTVKSKVKNVSPKAQETTFFMIIPDEAFVSGFIMEIGGKNYTAYVQEKKKAQETYNQAVQSGYGAAHVSVSARDSNKFVVSTNVEPESRATFYLMYEELLQRKDGFYEQVININPQQLVPDLAAEVDITEQRPLRFVKTGQIRSGNEISKESEDLNPNAIVERPDANSAEVKFIPSYEQQKKIASALGKEENDGIAGQFVVQYDVEREPHGGEILLKDGYFVHFFAPDSLKPLSKHIVFVLDTSGSMYDRKMVQLKNAMKNIVAELKPTDLFNLVEFNTNVKVWNLDAPSESTLFPSAQDNWYNGDEFFDITSVSFPPAYPVNNDTTAKVNKAVADMHATGGTNIYEALRVGLHLIKLRQTRTGDKSKQPLILFLTDGDPTVGKTMPDTIISGVSELNLGKVPIVSLSFGDGADRNFLKKISLNNFGFSRHIYEDSDADLQIENFYKIISSPLMNNVHFKYTDDASTLTTTDFPILYHGGELVVAGQLPDGKEFKEEPQVSGWSIEGPVVLKPVVKKAVGQLERLWAYMTVKKHLAAKETSKNSTEDEKKALALSLKYSFVTPVTSLVVVKPNTTDNAVDVNAADKVTPQFGGYGGGFTSGFGGGYSAAVGHRSSNNLISGQGLRPSFFHRPSFTQSGSRMALRKRGPLRVKFAPMAAFITTPRIIPRPIYGSTTVYGLDRGAAFSAAAAPTYPLVQTSDMLIGSDDVVDLRVELAEPTLSPTKTTTAKPIDLPADLKAGLPWLETNIDSHGNLKFFNNKYNIGLNATSPDHKECTDPLSEPGLCKLLKDCDVLHPKLTSPQTFKDYFCVIDNSFAGICCPKAKSK